ncbi:MAG TPA: phospholipase A, partial [Polyangiales bacterium]|nr:phospholipase A [Polyangiales bacterium]
MLTRLVGASLLCACALARAQDMATCAAIDDDAQRLRCYDGLSGRSSPEPPPTAQPEFRYRWEQHLLDDATRETFTLQGYQPTYALITHLSSFNYAPYVAVDPDNRDLSRGEIKFGFSLQTKVIDNLVGNNGDVWFAYTQTSYWQLFNTKLSSPFRET